MNEKGENGEKDEEREVNKFAPSAKKSSSSSRMMENKEEIRKKREGRGKRILVSNSAPNASNERSKFIKFIDVLNNSEIIEKLINKMFHTKNETTRIKTVDLITTIVRFIFYSQKTIPPLLSSLLLNIQSIKDVFNQIHSIPRDKRPPPLGFYRLSLIRLIRWLICMNLQDVWDILLKHSMFYDIFDLILVFPNNSILLFEIENIIAYICLIKNHHFIDRLISEFDFFNKFMSVATTVLEKPQFITARPYILNMCSTFIQYHTFDNYKSKDNWSKILESLTAGDADNPIKLTSTNSRSTASKQLQEHWEDFYYLFSSF